MEMERQRERVTVLGRETDRQTKKTYRHVEKEKKIGKERWRDR